jgi:hypothetical protein
MLKRPIAPVALLLALALSGCVERLISVRTEPSDATVFINGKLVGETPLDHEFDFYGVIDVVVRREGHVSQRERVELEVPWHQIFPLDFFAEFLVPWTIRDEHEVTIALETLPQEYDSALVERLKLRAQAERDRVRREADAVIEGGDSEGGAIDSSTEAELPEAGD